MNTIQQISLKLRLGIDPSKEVSPQTLRSLWGDATARKFGYGHRVADKNTATHESVRVSSH